MAGKKPSAGRVIVVSGPSGSGKSTLVRRALAAGHPRVRKKVSVTTRPPRRGEVDGVDYHFWKPEAFAAAVERGEFVEWAEVHGHRYGTLRAEVDPYLDQGTSVLMELDIQGAREVRRRYPDCLMVFVRASSLDAYERRLRSRDTENAAAIRTRLDTMRRELAAADEYDIQLINDYLDEAVERLREILRSGGERRDG